MKQVHVRLGPLALLLTVIVICLTVLGLLAVSTARGDMSMAQRYAESVEARYALETQGQDFLWRTARDPDSIKWLERDEDGTSWKVISGDGLSLRIGLSKQGKGFRVVNWQFVQDGWEPQEEMGQLWNGE